jgi:hypothetical protein
MMNNFREVLATLVICISMSSISVNAQFTGYTVELDTIFLEEGSDLEFYGTYRVYANFTNQNDAIKALYSDVVALGTPPMYIDAPCGCHNPVDGSVVMDATNSSSFWSTFPEYEYDTYWTIGMTSGDATGQLPSIIGMPLGDEICSSSTNDGAVFAIGIPPNALAGENLRVLIAQVTTCGDWSLKTCVATFINADQTDEEEICPDLLEVTHPYVDGECVNDTDGDGVCDEFEIAGCYETEACNYNPDATDDSMDCDYSCYGCLDEGACNFNSIATVDDGSCDYLSCAGCTNPMACNYDIDATIDNSTCIVPGDSCDDGDQNSINDVIQENCICQGYGCNDPDACNFSATAIPDPTICNYISTYTISGEVAPTANMLLSYSYPNTTGSTYDWVSTSGDVTDGEGTSDVNVAWWGSGSGSLCVTETNSGGCSGEEVCLVVNITPVSIDELENTVFDVYPTPASSHLHINLFESTLEEAILLLRDSSGRIVRSYSLQNATTIDVSDLSRGAYILQLNLGGASASYKHVILN